MSFENPVTKKGKELYPFTLVLPVPFEGDFYARRNESADALKAYLRNGTGRMLRANILGQFASGLVHGRLDRVQTNAKTGLYEITKNGKGITFHDPANLYYDWQSIESGAGPVMQKAMRNLIDFALETHQNNGQTDTPQQYSIDEAA